MSKPKCPDHPNVKVVAVYGVGGDQWFCLWCGRKLGSAPYEEIVETQIVKKKKKKRG